MTRRPPTAATRIGVPTEIKPDEHRVALTPTGAGELVQRGHAVNVRAAAGEGSGITDAAYLAHGVSIVPDADALFADSDLIVKVKEPQPRPGRLRTRPSLAL